MIDDQPKKLPQVPSMHLVPKGLVSVLLQCLNCAGGAAEGKLDSFSHFPAVAEILKDDPCICKLALVFQINNSYLILHPINPNHCGWHL